MDKSEIRIEVSDLATHFIILFTESNHQIQLVSYQQHLPKRVSHYCVRIVQTNVRMRLVRRYNLLPYSQLPATQAINKVRQIFPVVSRGHGNHRFQNVTVCSDLYLSPSDAKK